MTNGHLNVFINQFHFDSLLDQGHFVNALDSTLAHFIALATPFLTAYSSHPFCKAKAPLKWNTGILKVIIEWNDNCSATKVCNPLAVQSSNFHIVKDFWAQCWCSKWTLSCGTIRLKDPYGQIEDIIIFHQWYQKKLQTFLHYKTLM